MKRRMKGGKGNLGEEIFGSHPSKHAIKNDNDRTHTCTVAYNDVHVACNTLYIHVQY